MFPQARLNFSKTKEVVKIPDLISIQKDSYEWFLQKNTPPNERKPQGLQQLFLETFPITDFNERMILEFIEYTVGEPNTTPEEALEKNLTYSVPIKVKLRLINTKTYEMKEQQIYMRSIPYMTNDATFIINGTEMVVVSQLHRAPGLTSEYDNLIGGYIARIIPYKGVWVRFEVLPNRLIYVKFGQRKHFLATILLKALGYSTKEIIKFFAESRKCSIDELSPTLNYVVEEIDLGEEKIIPPRKLTHHLLEKMKAAGIKEVEIVYASKEVIPILLTLEKDTTTSRDDALLNIYSILKPGETATVKAAEILLHNTLFDSKRFNLSSIGRYKMNRKLSLDIPEEEMALTHKDIIETIKYLIKVHLKQVPVDDPDHLANKRVRPVGELLYNYLRPGFIRFARATRERMSTQDVESMTPQSVVKIKPITVRIHEFFNTNPLAQFMDQTNILSELTHKRRVSVLGPGGISKDRAGFEIRDVHYSHYGKLCPVETPEGANIGLILSFSTYARLNKYGFIETPYRKVINGKATDQIDYLSAEEEANYAIAEATTPLDKEGNIIPEHLPVRYKNTFQMVRRDKVDYIDASCEQMTSISTSLIPFLEHNDANRALMGSNMQRQAVPLLFPEAPIVGTGMEKEIAYSSNWLIKAPADGKITYVSADRIELQADSGEMYSFKLIKYRRSNKATLIHQKPTVRYGDYVKKGEILAEGFGVAGGELALGRNLLAAIMPWEGYNFEDAIVISERVVREDFFTSLHIEEYPLEIKEIDAEREYITRDIPGVPESALKNLDERGIVRIGTYVKPQDILVGKVSPRLEREISPEYRLLQSIFGEKVKELRDTSMRVPFGEGGVVIDIKYLVRGEDDMLAPEISTLIKVYVATLRKLGVGDKLAGRHGNKGVIAIILPECDMPYLEDGTPVDIIINPLTVPSRMNIGQLLELQYATVAKKMNKNIKSPIFSGADEKQLKKLLRKYSLPEDGKVDLYDGRTGEKFCHKVLVGYIYIMKLIHLVEEKIHARSIGPYSLITQQPLGGKAQFGGQRLGEMEVWAIEAYGAAHTLQELLTVKSDDIKGRMKLYESIIRGEKFTNPSVPESFNVLVKELQGLALDVKILDNKNRVINLNY